MQSVHAGRQAVQRKNRSDVHDKRNLDERSDAVCVRLPSRSMQRRLHSGSDAVPIELARYVQREWAIHDGGLSLRLQCGGDAERLRRRVPSRHHALQRIDAAALRSDGHVGHEHGLPQRLPDGEQHGHVRRRL